MKKLRPNSAAFRFLMDLWARHCSLTAEHQEWAQQHVTVQQTKRGQRLYSEGQLHKVVYLVIRGALARTTLYKDTYKRRILSVALPGMALMTTKHLYSNTPSKGDLVVLHAKTVVLEIPYKAFLKFLEQNPAIYTLNNVIANKKRKQLSDLIHVLQCADGSERLLAFRSEMKELHDLLSYQERADIIGISLATVKRMAVKMAKK